MDEIRVTAYRYALDHGLPCDLESLARLGGRAAQMARGHGLSPRRVPEGPYLVHSWPGWLWDRAARGSVRSAA